VSDTLWAIEARTRHECRCAVSVLVDRASNEVLYDAARRIALRRRRAAARGLRRALRADRTARVAAGLALRYDSGSCFRSDAYQAKIDHLGIARSLAFHFEPETNGYPKKEIQDPQAGAALDRDSNTLKHRLIERHSYLTPTEAREHLRAQARFGMISCPPERPANRDRRTLRIASTPSRHQP
jgi:hypothetical protein